MKPKDENEPRADLMFTLKPSTALREAAAALAEDVQRTREIMCETIGRSLAPFVEGGEVYRAALAACAHLGLAGRLADAGTGCAAGQAIAASAFRLPPEPEPPRIVLHVHVVRLVEDPPRVDAGEGEPREWEM